MSASARIVASIGGGLQVVGVALVFWEIWATQRALNKRTWTRAITEALTVPFRRLSTWLGSRRKPKASTVALEASVSASGTLSARVTINEPLDAPVEQRIEIHQQRLDAIDRQLDEIRAEAAKLHTNLGDRLNAAVGETMEETKRLREIVHQLGVGSIGFLAPPSHLGSTGRTRVRQRPGGSRMARARHLPLGPG